MNARDITALLADIGTEARRMIHGGPWCDVTVTFMDGTSATTHRGRYIEDRDAYAQRIWAWLKRTGRASRVESIQIAPYSWPHAYTYWRDGEGVGPGWGSHLPAWTGALSRRQAA